ncbi:S-layer homology domain-containing protein [Agathobaculum butyriciproducens]|uniref:S-layer homology domain-containing protein n=1 Tax=Agathobaculum butyriciproducens TaxID=1628085 RepID=UPI002096A7E9|nr:S-layer homology domain-containing protein [Agathobaculum butyriciproducens]
MLKKNTRKRLLAGALATVMMLTMCPSWALADDEDIALLPANEEIAVPVVDSTPAADPTETPADPTPSETEAKPENQNTAPAPSGDEANGGTDSTESGNSTNSTIPEGSENNSQNNDAVSNAPENEIASQDAPSHDAEVAPAYLLSDVTKTAECWVTNRHAADSDGNWKTTITNAVGDGADVTTLAAPTIEAGNETYVFWQARVLPIGQHQSNILNGDRTKDGTEIDRIRYVEATWTSDYFEYREKDTDSWKKFKTGDQLVFYYLVRTDYSEMVQIDVSDWTVNEEPSYDDRRSVTYQIIVDGGVDDGKVLDSKKFWYNKAFKVSSIRVREIGDHPNYSIDRVVLEPSTLGDPTKNENGEYRFSLDLTKAKRDEATVKIYVKPNVDPHQLTYNEDGGTITSEGYTVGSVYPQQRITVPEVEKEGHTFDGWFDENNTKYETGALMPDKNLTLTAHWTANTPTPPVEPETKTPAKYFVLLPNRGVPKSSESQGWTNYLPNETSDGGVMGATREKGYEGSLTAAGKEAADRGEFNVNGVNSNYLVQPTDLGFFTAANWNGTTYPNYPADKTNTSAADITALLGTNYNPQIAEVVWYTVKHDDTDGYHVDGYVKNVDVNVTYHSNFGTDVTEARTAKTGEVYNTVSYDELTELPSRPNYEFTGWYTDKECKQPYSPTLLMSSMDLYAGWKQTAFDVSYFYKDAQNVETQFGTTETYKVKSDVTVRTAHPEKEGYTFTGWTNIANIVTVDTTTGKFIMPAHHVRFDATFEINQYNVTYKVGTEVVGTDVYNFNSDVVIRPVPTKEGYTFTGWTSTDSAFDIRGFKMPAHAVVIEGKFEKNPAKQYTYTVNKHFYNEKGVEVNVVKGEATPAVENTAVSELYKDAAVNQTDKDGKTYVYVSGLTTVTDKLETLTKDVTIDLYYYLNVEGGNDIPDAWEYRLTFKVVNGEWNDGGNADIVTYVQFKDQKTGEAFKDEAVVVPVTRIPAVGEKPNSGYHAGAWDTSPYDNYKVQKDTVFTYTYAKNSSGGSSGGSHHRRPTVTIPDDVPTGLNGDDHYAYIVGYPDKTVRPQNGITRAEVATIFFRLLTDETRNANSTKSNSYSDVAAGAWYNHAVSTLSAMGIVKGDSHGKFNPNAPITRAEFAAIAARFDDKANTTTADFSDIASHWAKNEISAASNNGWITGYPDGTFRPDNKITRAEAMTLVNRVLKRLPETEEDLHDDMIKWSDNSDVSQWFYLDVQEATNSHYYQTKENQFEKWTKLRETRDWTELEK